MITSNAISETKTYEAAYKSEQLIYGKGEHLAIVCGWTPREKIVKHLNSDKYAVLGQLYSSARGVEFFLKNLFLNPLITDIVLIAATHQDNVSKSVDTLREILTKEHDTDLYRIPSLDLNILVGSLRVHYFSDIKLAVSFINNFKLTKYTRCRHRKPFYVNTPELQAIPSEVFGHRILGETIAETWLKILQRIRLNGVNNPTGYSGQWQELINLCVVVRNEPLDFYFPEPNHLPVDKEYIENYIPQMIADAPYKEGVKYTYGQRLRSWFKVDQIEQIIIKLLNEPIAASAVMSLWDVNDHERGGSPCLNHIWVRILNSKVTLTALFRSNDMYSAWVANAMGLRALQQHIANELNSRGSNTYSLGELCTISQSAHIYDDCYENADEIIKKHVSTKPVYCDPVGNFVIDKAEVIQMDSTNTTPIKTYTGNPRQILKDILSHNPTIEPEHYLYIWQQLQKWQQ